MPASLMELLSPQVVLRVVSRLKAGRGPLASWLGWQPTTYNEDTVSLSGPNTIRNGSVRNVTYRVFDHTRVPMRARAPGTGPATIPANPMGQNTVSIARFHQKVPLLYEFLGNLSPMIGPNSQVDEGGQNYITQQITYLAEQANNMVEVMAAAMLRDSLYFVYSGDNWLPTFTAPVAPLNGFQVKFNVPTGNTGQLNMLGTGNIITVGWNNVAASIVGQLQQIIAAYAQLSRFTMTEIWINSTMWLNVITNTEVRNLAGSANTPFAEFDSEEEPGMEGSGPANRYSAILRGQPTIRWHFCDDAVALSPLSTGGSADIDPIYTTYPATALATLAKLVPDNTAIFTTAPTRDWQSLMHGGEYVVENPGQPASLKVGYHFWKEFVTQPSALEILALLNAVPALFVPNVVAFGQVVSPTGAY